MIMKPTGKIVALIPLRGGSKSIPKKNIRLLCGKPLCAWCIESVLSAPEIDEIYVSTDSKEIANTVKTINPKISIIDRPSELAQDDSSTESVMLHFASLVNFDWIVTLQATSPLIKSKHISEAISKVSSDNLDSLLSAVRVKRFFWSLDSKPLNYNPQIRPRRQDFEGTYMENGAFYITKREILIKTKCRLGGKIGIYEMPYETNIELDEPEDWLKIEEILRKEKHIQ